MKTITNIITFFSILILSLSSLITAVPVAAHDQGTIINAVEPVNLKRNIQVRDVWGLPVDAELCRNNGGDGNMYTLTWIDCGFCVNPWIQLYDNSCNLVGQDYKVDRGTITQGTYQFNTDLPAPMYIHAPDMSGVDLNGISWNYEGIGFAPFMNVGYVVAGFTTFNNYEDGYSWTVSRMAWDP